MVDSRMLFAPTTDPVDRSATETSSAAASPARLRVCHVAYTFYEGDNRVMRYAREMASQGHDVDVVALRQAGQPTTTTLDGVRVMRIQQRSVTERAAVVYLAKLLWFLAKATALLSALHLKRRYDVVHVHNVPDFLIFAAIVPKLGGARLILDIHDIVPELYAGKFGGDDQSPAFRSLVLVERASCALANHVIVANDLWHDTLVRRSARHCTTILNYPDLSIFKPLPAEPRKGEGPFVFLYPGSLNHHQGVDIAVKAFSLVQNEMRGAELHVYGEGPAKPLLIRLVDDLNLAGRVRIMDRVPITEMARLIAAADVGVVPKRADGFGNEAFSTKILEFMASGVPVIVSRTRVDAHHFNSMLVRFFVPGDERDLAMAMLDVFTDRGNARTRADAAHRFAVRNSWQARGGDYRELIAALVAPASSRQAAPR
jgi:glycosyltransferase involved in cell wall biosynthesis